MVLRAHQIARLAIRGAVRQDQELPNARPAQPATTKRRSGLQIAMHALQPLFRLPQGGIRGVCVYLAPEAFTRKRLVRRLVRRVQRAASHSSAQAAAPAAWPEATSQQLKASAAMHVQPAPTYQRRGHHKAARLVKQADLQAQWAQRHQLLAKVAMGAGMRRRRVLGVVNPVLLGGSRKWAPSVVQVVMSGTTHKQVLDHAAVVLLEGSAQLQGLIIRLAPAPVLVDSTRLQAPIAARLAVLVCTPAQARGRVLVVSQVNILELSQVDAIVAISGATHWKALNRATIVLKGALAQPQDSQVSLAPVHVQTENSQLQAQAAARLAVLVCILP
jgi:hypothetical protein